MKVYVFSSGSHSWDVVFVVVLAESEEQARELIKKESGFSTEIEWEFEEEETKEISKPSILFESGSCE